MKRAVDNIQRYFVKHAVKNSFEKQVDSGGDSDRKRGAASKEYRLKAKALKKSKQELTCYPKKNILLKIFFSFLKNNTFFFNLKFILQK